MLKKDIGQRLQYLRKAHKYSLRSLADNLNINYSTLHKIEIGENYPSIDLLEKLSDFFDVSMSYFLVEEEYDEWINFGEKMSRYNLKPNDLEEILRGILKYIRK